ncbi:P-loop containing nucleoside triphosphate hydrolase protein [Phanerochaete sordida]|uniref:DNA 3'-5' helicase n=1 Tax=Phanerochaete sordida TaxID=48140 RepID=A0A9P3LG15_9APHY|nr:P-loop containing nucleoside triphosphate hydrolase protein [Phanerochaete sordida]
MPISPPAGSPPPLSRPQTPVPPPCPYPGNEASYTLLQNTRRQATAAHGYSSETTRNLIIDTLKAKYGVPPHCWQVDVSEAFHLRLDVSLIAGTGAGKTWTFLGMLAADTTGEKLLIVVCPLNELQRDQVKRFKRAGYPAAAVNSDTWSKELREDLINRKFRAIFTSPEMLLEHHGLSALIRTPSFTENVLGIAVDEAHTITLWGAEFRKQFAELERLRACLPLHIPILATSATMTPAILKDVHEKLRIRPEKNFHLNLGNDRPNITQIVVRINSPNDFSALDFVLDEVLASGDPKDLLRTLVFVKTRDLARNVWEHLNSKLPAHLRSCIDFLHAGRHNRAKRRVMRRFRAGEIRLLVATEAAGLGLDIGDIVRVVQYLVPGDLNEWIQHHGRAGRGGQPAIAIMLVEATAFQLIKKRKRRRKKGQKGLPASVGDAGGANEASSDEDEDGGNSANGEDDSTSNEPNGRPTSDQQGADKGHDAASAPASPVTPRKRPLELEEPSDVPLHSTRNNDSGSEDEGDDGDPDEDEDDTGGDHELPADIDDTEELANGALAPVNLDAGDDDDKEFRTAMRARRSVPVL